jgi:uncharacterized membrane protein (UPF0182 family)
MSEMRRFPPKPSGGRRGPLKLLLALVILIVVISASVSLYIDNLWFDSVGFASVFWYGVEARSKAFLAFFLLTTAFLFLSFRILLGVAGSARRPLLMVQGRYINTPSIDDMKTVSKVVAVIVGLLAGVGFSSLWETYALYFNQPSASGIADPILGKPLEFFFFTLPVLDVISGWFLLVVILSLVGAIVLIGMGLTANFRGVSLAVSLLMLALALRTFLGRYGLLLEDYSLFSGMRYVDNKVVAIGLLVTAAALVVSAAILALNRSARLVLNGMAIAIPVAAYLIGLVLIPWYVTTFIVVPNGYVIEKPYIRHNMEFTRRAFGLDHVEEMPFEPRQTNAVFDPAKHQSTLENMRLWDWQALRDTLIQIQEIRTYYDFPDVDIDRYTSGGKVSTMMVASRELDVNRLPAGSRSWVNDRLTYTHGYGVTMNSANGFTREGLPDFVLSNMPVQGTLPDIQVKRPEIYFGERTTWPVYVKTGQKEFNYPEGESNNFNTFEGHGGIRMGGLLRRILLAAEVGDLLTVPFSNDVTADSFLLLHRNIVDRVSKLAPFLSFDDDPYMVVGDDGALYWMMDGYTTSDRYPYSRHIVVERESINYIRNSVKVVIDAYNGDVRFYVFEPDDPLIRAYQSMFPSLFQPKSAMPDFLMKHIRYPERLFQAQALMYSAYHVDNEQVFYNREDVWSIAQQTRTQGGGQAAEAIQPFFIQMTFPGESNLEFVSILPFTPSRRNNMIGWIAARSDGDAYGKLRAYHLPKTKFVDGPLQIQAKIDQDPQLSSQLTLWNQQGSAVIRGNLLVIPIDDILLFAEPIYLQAQRSPMPALRLIVLATQDRLAYATTFDEALKLLLEGRSGTLVSQTSSDSPKKPGGAPSVPSEQASTQTLIHRASQALSDYRRLTAEGRLAEAGAKLDELKAALEQLNQPGASSR